MHFLAWDELNSTRDTACWLDVEDASEAAILYAQGDTDGHCDMLYTQRNGWPIDNVERDGHPVIVEHPDGQRERWCVGVVEYQAIYGAARASDQAGAFHPTEDEPEDGEER